jgi:N-acetylglucosaminyldiphosphoundecaprenol N-acetyl-beta-D-mannosaminyltransferase
MGNTTVTTESPADARFRIGHVPIDPLSREDATYAIERLVERGQGGEVFTPSVEHVILAELDGRVRTAHSRADLCLATGGVLVWASRVLGKRLPEQMSLADVVLPLMAWARRRGRRVYLLGRESSVVCDALAYLERSLPGLRIAGGASRTAEQDGPAAILAAVVEDIRRCHSDLVLVALGTPEQELFIEAARALLPSAVFLEVGTSLELALGSTPQMPARMSSMGIRRLDRFPVGRRVEWGHVRHAVEFLKILLTQRWRIIATELESSWGEAIP